MEITYSDLDRMIDTKLAGRVAGNGQIEQGQDKETKHNFHKEVLSDVGANWLDCPTCGLQTVNNRPFTENNWHDCPECDANRVKNGASNCPWCGKEQGEDE